MSECTFRWEEQISAPLKVAGVESDLDGDGAARVQVAAVNGDPRSSGDGPVWRLHTSEVRWLDTHTEFTMTFHRVSVRDHTVWEWSSPQTWRLWETRPCTPADSRAHTPPPERPAHGNLWRRPVDTRSCRETERETGVLEWSGAAGGAQTQIKPTPAVIERLIVRRERRRVTEQPQALHNETPTTTQHVSVIHGTDSQPSHHALGRDVLRLQRVINCVCVECF